ncbi:hypothetical protein, partial [Rhizobium brockwellii]|uniref:hypothetical protein n=1 Tax=Rhizobium brockwellii TaxID=3019932 RepID=UPI003F9CB722
DDEFGKLNEPVRAKAPTALGERMETSMDPSMGSRTASPRRIVSAPSMCIYDDDDYDDDLPFDNDMPPRPADILPDDDEDDD